MAQTIKLVIIGPSGVGKTSLRGQYISGRFSSGYRATIGADFISKTLPNPMDPTSSVTLQIWDTAGQERFSSLSSAFFRGADAALIMFDVLKRSTLLSVRKWWDEFCERRPLEEGEPQKAFCIVIVGNKVDLETEGQENRVGWEEAEQFVRGLISGWDAPLENYFEAAQHSPPAIYVNGNTGNLFLPLPAHVRHRTQSLDILSSRKRLSGTYSHSRSHSRGSSSRLYPMGTMTTTHTFHTAASSLADRSSMFESARSSPVRSLSPVGSNGAESQRGSPSTGSLSNKRHLKRDSGSSSSESGVTITPAMFHALSNLSTSVTATPSSPSTPFPATSSPSLPPMTPPPEGPALFFTSAKTGEGVKEVFEYIAARVVRRWEWEDAQERRGMHVTENSTWDSDASTVRLGSRRGMEDGFVGRCCS